MKIAHITSVHNRFDTRILLKECCSLAEAGYNVSLVVADGNGDEIRDGVQIYDVGKFSSRFSRIIRSTYRLVQKAAESNPEVYHLHDPELLSLGLILRIFRKKVVYDMHENFAQQVKNKKWIPFFVRHFLSIQIYMIERLFLNNINVIFAEKSYEKYYLWIKNKQIIQNFPIINNFKHLININKRNIFTVGYIGDVTFDRGIPVIADAVLQLRQQGIAAEFLCVGAVHEDVLDSAPFQKGLSQGWLHSTGRLQPEEAWSRIADCHVGAALLRPIGNYVESYPTKMFEYMAMGLPVLVSDFLLYRRIVDEYECGLCVDPESVEEVTRALLFFHHDLDQSREMGRRGYNAVLKKFNWETEKGKLIGFYGGLV